MGQWQGNISLLVLLFKTKGIQKNSKTCQTGDTDHDGNKRKIEEDIVDKPVKPVNNLLVRLK